MENPVGQLEKLFRHLPKLFVPSCEYAKHSKKIKDDFTGHCEIIKCLHGDNKECVKWLLRGENRHRYIIATKDSEKLAAVKKTRNVPVLKLFGTKLVLDVKSLRVRSKKRGGEAQKEELERLEKLFGINAAENVSGKERE